MIPGIDPKIDIAFRKVFGSEPWRDLTVALINAVLESLPPHRVVDVELLNPYSDKLKLDDKLSILDIKARDQEGWLYNVEMQMLALAALVQRLLYYFLKNGRGLDADALPGELDRRSELRKAMGVLKMLAQNDMERELYEGRLKAKRDMQTLETQRRTLETQGRTLEMQRRALETERDHWQERYEAANCEREQATREREQATREREQATREREQATREREQARREVHRELAERVRLCQRLLRRQVSEADELLGQSVEALHELAESLERDLTR